MIYFTLQIFAIELFTFAVDFVPLAVEFGTFAVVFVPLAVELGTFAVEFVALALQFVALAMELDAFAIELGAFALEFVAFAQIFVHINWVADVSLCLHVDCLSCEALWFVSQESLKSVCSKEVIKCYGCD